MTSTLSAASPPTATRATPAATAAVEVRDLSFRYPKSDRPSLQNVTLSVREREVFGVLGPNGGGKTTLFRLLCTMLPPQASAGQVTIAGHDLVTQPGRVREQLGVVFQHPSLDARLTAEENLRHGGKLYGLGGAVLRERIDAALRGFGLDDRRRDLVGTFSGGMRRRLELAKALLHRPRVLLLDEPSTGLDPGARRDLWKALAEARDRFGVTVVLTTHLMDEAERCDRLAILAEGRLVALDTPAALRSRVGGEVVTLTLDLGDGEELADVVRRVAAWSQELGLEGVSPAGTSGVRFEARGSSVAATAVRDRLRGSVRSVTVGQPTLEDVFLRLTGRAFE